MPAQQNTGLPAEVVDAALTNPHIRQRAEKIMDMLFDEVEDTIRLGSAMERQGLVKVVMPAVLRSLQSAQQDQAAADMKSAYLEMRQAFGAFAATRGDHDAEPTPTDTPPSP
jgi:hypothetical protein